MTKTALDADIEIPHSEKLHATKPDEFRKIVENRRSIRVYEKEPIPEVVVRDCLELALLAPNSSNLQTWEFYWVRSPEKKALLAKYCFGQNAAKTAAELIVCVGRIDTIFDHARQMVDQLQRDSKGKVPNILLDYYRKLVPFVYASGPFSLFAPFKWLLFNVAGFFRVVPREPLGKGDLRLWAAKSSALACENLMLAFASHGYDTCPMEGFDSKRVKKLLGLPRSCVVTMVISAGKRSPKGVYGPRVRFPSSQFVKEV